MNIFNLDPDTIAIYGELVVIGILMIVIMWLLQENVKLKTCLTVPKDFIVPKGVIIEDYGNDTSISSALNLWLLTVHKAIRQGIPLTYSIQVYEFDTLSQELGVLKKREPFSMQIGDLLVTISHSYFNNGEITYIQVYRSIDMPVYHPSCVKCNVLELLMWVRTHKDAAIEALHITERQFNAIACTT